MVVSHQGALALGVNEPVVPDRGRESEQSLGDSHGDAGSGVAAVLLKAELTPPGKASPTVVYESSLATMQV